MTRQSAEELAKKIIKGYLKYELSIAGIESWQYALCDEQSFNDWITSSQAQALIGELVGMGESDDLFPQFPKQNESFADYVGRSLNYGQPPMQVQEQMKWVKASDRLPEIVGKKVTTRFVKVEIKKYGGGTFVSKRSAYYFPEHFKTVEWEDWDDYEPEDFPYTEDDKLRECVWLRPGWYEDVHCDRCDACWNEPLNVIEWLDESHTPTADELPNQEYERFDENADNQAEGK
jgi:hypothetical protein